MSRKLDVAIAEALGYEVKYCKLEGTYFETYCIIENNTPVLPVSLYSREGNAMLALDREMRKRSRHELQLRYHPLTGFTAVYINGSGIHGAGWGRSDTEPLARALAAYKVLTGENWDEENA